MPPPWEACYTLGTQWQFKPTNEEYKTGGELVEYKPDADPTPKYEQKGDELRISVVRAQRLYNNHRWPNSVVVKLTDVVPAR